MEITNQLKSGHMGLPSDMAIGIIGFVGVGDKGQNNPEILQLCEL